MRNWPAAVLFDFDGVIVNSEPLHLQAFQEVLAEEKIELSEEEYYREMIGFDDKGAFRHIFQLRGKPLDPKTFLRVVTRKSEVMMDIIRRRKVEALPGAEEFIRGLWRNYPLGVCSGALREEIEVMLEGVSLRDCFSTIVAAEDVTVGKPDPQGYLLTMKQLAEKSKRAMHPGDCIIIEDAPTVISSVKQAGFKVLGVANTYSVARLKDADWAVPSLQLMEIEKVLPELKMGIS